MDSNTRIQELIDLVPTLQLEHGELDSDKPVIMADEEPIFRVRTNAMGRAYANLIVEVIPLLSQLFGLASDDTADPVVAKSALPAEPPAAPRAAVDGTIEADVRSRIEGVLSMQPEFKAKGMIMSKLVYAAVSPYLSGAEREPSSVRVDVPALSKGDIQQHRSSAVADFIGWLAENSKLPLSDESAMEDAFMQWEESRHDDN